MDTQTQRVPDRSRHSVVLARRGKRSRRSQVTGRRMGRDMSKRKEMDASADHLTQAVNNVAEQARRSCGRKPATASIRARRQEALRPLIDSLILLLDRIEAGDQGDQEADSLYRESTHRRTMSTRRHDRTASVLRDKSRAFCEVFMFRPWKLCSASLTLPISRLFALSRRVIPTLTAVSATSFVAVTRGTDAYSVLNKS